MSLDDYKFRAITYQGVTFPATLMGISILEPLPDIKDENLAEWLWRLTICCGFTKRAPAEKCVKCARQAADLMLEHRQGLLDGIRNRLAPHGLETETTYSAWLLSLQRLSLIHISEPTRLGMI